jgi:hypothetical protein
MSESESYSENDEAYEQLVAYLDGELDAETSKQVERRLAEHVEYRRELQQLQRAWDMLDELPRAEVGESFTQTTVEMVALSAARELTEVKGRSRRLDRVLWGAAGAGIVITALTSYLVFSAFFSRPNTQLKRDLPVIENIELYQIADSVEFLRQLEDTGLFVTAWFAAPERAEEPQEEEPQEEKPQEEKPQEQGTEKLEQMSDAEKTALLQKKRRFDELSLAEQAKPRQIHDELARDPRQADLRRVLERYHDWLRTLTPPERAEVLSLPADKRIEKIQELTRTQDAKRFRMMAGGFMMSPQDLTVIHDWFDKFIDDHTREILATLPDQPFAKLKKEYDPARDRNFLRFLYIRGTSPNLPRPSQQDEAQLLTKVSPEAREVLAKAGEPERTRIIQWWIGAAVLSRMRTNPTLEELQKFAQESLSDPERFRLESLPRDRMYRELRFLYSQRRFAGDPSRGFPWGRHGGDRKPGPEGGPGFEGPPPPQGPGFPSPWEFPGQPRGDSGQ